MLKRYPQRIDVRQAVAANRKAATRHLIHPMPCRVAGSLGQDTHARPLWFSATQVPCQKPRSAMHVEQAPQHLLAHWLATSKAAQSHALGGGQTPGARKANPARRPEGHASPQRHVLYKEHSWESTHRECLRPLPDSCCCTRCSLGSAFCEADPFRYLTSALARRRTLLRVRLAAGLTLTTLSLRADTRNRDPVAGQ